MSDTPAVYGLVDPRTDQIRYIGWSTKPRRRMGQHCRQSELRRAKCHRSAWVRQLLGEGMKPELLILEEGPADWREAERFWIEYFRAIGANLTNLQEGGDMDPSIHKRSPRATKGQPLKKLHAVRKLLARYPEKRKRVEDAIDRVVARVGSRRAVEEYLNERMTCQP